VRNSVTRSANVSLADLDLSTLEGSSSERLEAMPGAFAASLPDGKTFRISRTMLPACMTLWRARWYKLTSSLRPRTRALHGAARPSHRQ